MANLVLEKKRDTNHAVSWLVENIVEAFENKQVVLRVFLNLSKAFDTIDHTTLLQKLQHYGIRGLAYDWFCSYMCTFLARSTGEYFI